MKAEILRDKTVNILDRMMNGVWIDRACRIVMAVAVGYFGAHVCAALMR